MSKIRKSAKGRDCEIRIEGVCCGNPETTVLAHRNGGGIGRKKRDTEGAFACATCHTYVDRLPTINHLTDFNDAIDLLKFWDGIFRTQEILIKEGLLVEKR